MELPGAEWLEQRKLFGTGTDAGDNFGEVLAIDRDRLVVGVRDRDGGGALYLFERNAGGPERWGEVAIVPKPPEVVGEFGYTVDIDGDRLVAGSGEIGDRVFDGAFIYERQADGQWLRVARLTEPPDPKGGEGLGRSVAVAGDTVFAGNRLYDFSTGAVWVFERDAGGPGNWGVVARLTAEHTKWLGLAMAADGDRLLAGAEATNSNTGAAVLFERDEGSGDWIEAIRLTASDGLPGDRFGGAVDISGDRLIIGAYTFGVVAGQVYVFERDEDGLWLEVARLRPKEEVYYFGRSVSIDGDRALVGSDNSGEPETSGVWVYERQQDGEWLEVARLNPADQANADLFGFATGLGGVTAVAGSPFDDDLGSTAGAVYVFLERKVELAVTGACPGETTVELVGATPRAPVAVLAGFPGTTEIPIGPCAGVEVGLSVPMVVGTPRTDADGVVTVTRTLGAGGCGHALQVVDLATCALSSVVPMP